MFQSKPIGETLTKTIERLICRECGCLISETGLCSYECSRDATHPDLRDPATIAVRVWQRTDTLVEERPYSREPSETPLAHSDAPFGTHVKEAAEIVKDWIG